MTVIKTKRDRKYLERFATEHKVIFIDQGEVGFGQPCVGLNRDSGYIDFRPRHMKTYESIEGFDGDFYAGEAAPDAYHKHDCLAVLVHGDEYDAAIGQLAAWIRELESRGKLEIVQYENGYGPQDGIAAMLHGLFGWAIRYKMED